LSDRKVRRCPVVRLRPCLVHGLDGASRSKALSFARTEGLFFFARGEAYLSDKPISLGRSRC